MRKCLGKALHGAWHATSPVPGSCFISIIRHHHCCQWSCQFRAWLLGSPEGWLPGPAGFKFICSFICSFICYALTVHQGSGQLPGGGSCSQEWLLAAWLGHIYCHYVT